MSYFLLYIRHLSCCGGNGNILNLLKSNFKRSKSLNKLRWMQTTVWSLPYNTKDTFYRCFWLFTNFYLFSHCLHEINPLIVMTMLLCLNLEGYLNIYKPYAFIYVIATPSIAGSHMWYTVCWRPLCGTSTRVRSLISLDLSLHGII